MKVCQNNFTKLRNSTMHLFKGGGNKVNGRRLHEIIECVGISPAAGRASTSGSTSSGSRGSRMLPLASHVGACGALRSTAAAAALCWRGLAAPRTCAHTHPAARHVPRLQQVTVRVAAPPRDVARHIRRCCRRSCPIRQSSPTD